MSFPKDQVVVGSLGYVFDDDRVLLLKRSRPPQQDLWTAPGGKLETGESPEDCLARELHEETGLTITAPRLKAVVTVYDVAWPIHWLLFIFRVDQFSGGLRPCDEGELRWVALDALKDYTRPHADKQHWSHILQPGDSVWRGKFIYDTPHHLSEEIRYTEDF